jgi:membrane fusion protein, heavy metal efflux system
MTKNNLTIPIIITGVSIFIFSCNKSNKAGSLTNSEEVLPDSIVELRGDQIKVARVELGSIVMQLIGDVINANGIITVAPQNHATVCMPFGGFIKNTTLLPGNYVSKGETLAVIENQEFVDIQQNYLEAKNKLSFAKAEYDRHTDLYRNDVYSEQNLQQVTVDYKNLTAIVKSLEQKLSMIGIDPGQLKEENINSSVSLRSPISGYLKSVNVNIGKYVSPADVLFEIVNSEQLFLELTLFEKDAEKAARGQKIKFFVNNGNEEHEAVVTQTGKSITEDKTLKVFATVTSPSENILPGMYVNAYIQESGHLAATLPSEAVVTFNDKDYIFVFDKNKEEAGKPFTEYRFVEVTKGITASGYTEINLPAGFDITSAKVVIKGAYDLLSAKKNAGEMAC